MSKKLQLSIDDPCHENWDKMTKSEQGRFCASCQKHVHDFTGMSDSQLVAFFKSKPADSVCGRFYPDQLDRDMEIPTKRIPWVKYFFQFVLPAFLMSAKATAQKGKTKIVETGRKSLPEVVVVSKINHTPSSDTSIAAMLAGRVAGPVITSSYPPGSPGILLKERVKPIPQLTTPNDGKIRGRVVSENGEPVSFSTLFLKGTSMGTLANEKGEFTITPPDGWQSVVLVASCVGFTVTEKKIQNDSNSANIVLSIPLSSMTMGVIVRKPIKKKKESKPVPLLTQILMDTASKYFKIFPNPVSSGASLHIEWKKMEEGYYTLELLDLSGKLVYSREIWIDSEARLLNIEIPSVTAGNYFLRAVDKKSGKSSTEKIIIQ